jgi:hypothetical protein
MKSEEGVVEELASVASLSEEKCRAQKPHRMKRLKAPSAAKRDVRRFIPESGGVSGSNNDPQTRLT